MTIFGNLLARGYFPKELPPAFFTDEFSRYARTMAGRQHIETYNPPERRTDTVRYRLALPGRHGLGFRSLAIPHPWAFAKTAAEVSKNFRRLLKKAGRSKISKSRPVYATGMPRAMRTLVRLSNLARERAHTRAASTHLLKVDVSQFYPSLYTHAVGWSNRQLAAQVRLQALRAAPMANSRPSSGVRDTHESPANPRAGVCCAACGHLHHSPLSLSC